MLQIKNVTVTHKKDLRTIMKDVSLVLNPGDRMAVIGEEGNGKSTLLKWIYDPALVESYAEVIGERTPGRERLAYLPQSLPEEDAYLSVYEFFSAEPAFWDKNPAELASLAKGSSAALYEWNASMPTVRIIVVFGEQRTPFDPVFIAFIKDSFFSGKEHQSHVLICVFIACRMVFDILRNVIAKAAGCAAEDTAVEVNRGDFIKQPVDGQIGCFCSRTIHESHYI